MAHSCKLFVRNLPFQCTDEKLENLFSDDGPLKACFVVKDNDKQQSRGYGFVTFALREDAKKVTDSEKWFEGKKLHIEYATSKASDKNAKRGKKQQEDGNSKSTTEASSDQKQDLAVDKKSTKRPAQRKLLSQCDNKCKLQVTNIPQQINQNKVKKFFEQFGTVSGCNLIRNRSRRSVGKAFITFGDVADADKCLELSNQEGDPLLLGGSHLTVVKALAQEELKGSNEVQSRLPAPDAQPGRIVIRNLSFQCTMDDVKGEFSQFGEIVHLALPMNSVSSTHKGFAFLQYETKEAATKAVQAMNSKELNGRPIAVDFALPRDEYRKAKQMKPDTDTQLKREVPRVKDTSIRGKDSDKEDDSDSDDDDEDDEGDDNDADDDEDEGSISGNEDGDESSDEGIDSDADSDHDMDEPKQISDVNKGTTVFVRNLPYEVTDSDLRKCFLKYGLVKSCHLVLDPATDQPRGSGFVQFVKKEHAEKCLQDTREEANPPELHGRVLTVVKALSREKSADLQEKRKKIVRMEEKDPRNTYLLREGFIRPGTQAAVGLSEQDLRKRSKVEGVKRAKLKNIYIFVSKTRLVVHNLPKSVDDKKLKEIFRSAVKAKSGVYVSEAKVMMDKSEVDADGKRSSLGYGFVSFREHTHALEALRTVNNNPSYFGNSRRLIVGFSLENKKALEKKQRQAEKSKVKQGHTKVVKSGKPESEKVTKTIDLETDPRVDIAANTRKGLPKHSHAKVRWRDRGKKEREERQQRLERRKRLFVEQGGTKQSLAAIEIVGAKSNIPTVNEPIRKKRRKDEKEEKRFESLVAKYKKTIGQSTEGSKWFD